MLNNTPKKKKKTVRPIKRVIDWECYNPYTKWGQNICSIRVVYIIDKGDLIQDVQVKHTEFVGEFTEQQKEARIKKYSKSKQNVKTILENAIYRTGANMYTAENTARKLLSERNFVATR